MNEDIGAKLMRYAAIGVGLMLLFIAFDTLANGLGEDEPWKFRTPMEKSVIQQDFQLKALSDGGYFQGSHASRVYNVEANIDRVDADEMLFQEITNVGNQNINTVEGDGNSLIFEADQTSDKQSGQNGAVIGEGDTTQDMSVGG